LSSALAGARTPGNEAGGTIAFRVLGPASERVLVSLSPERCTLESRDEDAALIVYCDAEQLSQLIEGHALVRPLRTHGDRHLLEVLASLIRVAKDPLSIRGGR
jgi:hypothetical protein